MYRPEYQKLFQRLLILAILGGCLFVLTSSLHRRVLAATCQSCDESRYGCMTNCSTQHWYCVNGSTYSQQQCDEFKQLCVDGCQNNYSSCLNFCTFREDTPGGGGGGGGSCGLGRTPCELSCRDARAQCVAEGGTTCGADYSDCMNACCP
jgi:hypothetical protein